MKRKGRQGRSPIGVDLGKRHIKAAQLRHSGDGWRVIAAAALPRENPDGEIDRSEARQLRGVGIVPMCLPSELNTSMTPVAT